MLPWHTPGLHLDGSDQCTWTYQTEEDNCHHLLHNVSSPRQTGWLFIPSLCVLEEGLFHHQYNHKTHNYIMSPHQLSRHSCSHHEILVQLLGTNEGRDSFACHSAEEVTQVVDEHSSPCQYQACSLILKEQMEELSVLPCCCLLLAMQLILHQHDSWHVSLPKTQTSRERVIVCKSSECFQHRHDWVSVKFLAYDHLNQHDECGEVLSLCCPWHGLA